MHDFAGITLYTTQTASPATKRLFICVISDYLVNTRMLCQVC
jgi:hypothetical protein